MSSGDLPVMVYGVINAVGTVGANAAAAGAVEGGHGVVFLWW